MNVDERARHGRDARKRVSRSSHGDWMPPADRPDPLVALRGHECARESALLPIRHGRMAASASAFLRGAAAVMAADLAADAHTGLITQLCGDAHLLNFGLYAAPGRAPVFDLSDFDETYPGPFEWDVKRLAASVAVAARDNGHPTADVRRAAGAAATAYRRTMRRLAGLGELASWYERVDPAEAIWLLRGHRERRNHRDHRERRRAERSATRARRRGSRRAGPRAPGGLTVVEDGVRRLADDPPLIERTLDAGDGTTADRLFEDYRDTLTEEHRVLLDRYRFADAAREVAGVGGVGTRCLLVLLEGRDAGDPLLLRMKEADLSVLQAHLPARGPEHHGHRVVSGQRLTQASGDVFLGWMTDPAGRHLYWRRVRDLRGTARAEGMPPHVLRDYAALCGRTLAHAHARAGDRIAIASYLGKADTFDRAIAAFALTYADVTAADHAVLVRAVQNGTLPARTGI